jgi:cytochrome c553
MAAGSVEERTMKTKIALTIGLLLSASASVIVAKDAPMFVWNRTTLGMVEAASVGRGQQIAEEQKCAKCHGKIGVSEDEDSPNIAGQKGSYVAKQLADYKAEAREEKSMTKAARKLNPQDMADLGAFYATQKPEKAAGKVKKEPLLVSAGDEKRFLLPCGSCHGKKGEGFGHEVPALMGQKGTPFLDTMKAFKDEDRANDHYGRMRFIAAQLTDDEIAAIVAYYRAPEAAPKPDKDD